MLPKDTDELDKIRRDCKKLVTRLALAAGATSAMPLPGVDIAADMAILSHLFSSVNERFGLDKDQVDGYPEPVKRLIYQLIKKGGLLLVGSKVTSTVIAAVLQKAVAKTAARQVLKFVPVMGWTINAGIGFAAMKYVGNRHVDDCYDVCRKLMESGCAAAVPDSPDIPTLQ